jgi:hypothetical protein
MKVKRYYAEGKDPLLSKLQENVMIYSSCCTVYCQICQQSTRAIRKTQSERASLFRVLSLE